MWERWYGKGNVDSIIGNPFLIVRNFIYYATPCENIHMWMGSPILSLGTRLNRWKLYFVGYVMWERKDYTGNVEFAMWERQKFIGNAKFQWERCLVMRERWFAKWERYNSVGMLVCYWERPYLGPATPTWWHQPMMSPMNRGHLARGSIWEPGDPLWAMPLPDLELSRVNRPFI
jgi:hypothetical protein